MTIRAGISTACFYPQNTEEALTQLAGAGVGAAEVFLNSASELAVPYLKELRRIADEGGTRILSVHPFTSGFEPMLFFSRYRRRFEDSRDLYRKFCQAAAVLGGDILVFHGNQQQMFIEWEELIERFGILLEDAAREGVRLCHENVCRCIGRSPDFFRRLSAELPDATFVFDVKQAVRAGEDPLTFAEAMGNRIAHIHISDHSGKEDCLPPGQGVFNISDFLFRIGQMGFDGGVMVELYRENFADMVELFDGYQHVSRILQRFSTSTQNRQTSRRNSTYPVTMDSKSSV